MPGDCVPFPRQVALQSLFTTPKICCFFNVPGNTAFHEHLRPRVGVSSLKNNIYLFCERTSISGGGPESEGERDCPKQDPH